MSFLRRDRLTLTIALLAALAVMFVSTVSMACEAPLDEGMNAMSMNDDSALCEQKTVRASCQRACLIFCQGLVTDIAAPALARLYASLRYPALEARHADFTREPDDPPPRL